MCRQHSSETSCLSSFVASLRVSTAAPLSCCQQRWLLQRGLQPVDCRHAPWQVSHWGAVLVPVTSAPWRQDCQAVCLHRCRLQGGALGVPWVHRHKQRCQVHLASSLCLQEVHFYLAAMTLASIEHTPGLVHQMCSAHPRAGGAAKELAVSAGLLCSLGCLDLNSTSRGGAGCCLLPALAEDGAIPGRHQSACRAAAGRARACSHPAPRHGTTCCLLLHPLSQWAAESALQRRLRQLSCSTQTPAAWHRGCQSSLRWWTPPSSWLRMQTSCGGSLRSSVQWRGRPSSLRSRACC